MKKVFLFSLFALLLASSCIKQECLDPDPHDATRIGGAWSGRIPAHPDWTYHFNQGLLTLSVPQVGQPDIVTTTEYSIHGDTVFFLPGPAYWVVFFHGDQLVECRTHGSGVISPTLFLQRME